MCSQFMRDPRPMQTKPERTSLETYAKGFEEYLQSPLQVSNNWTVLYIHIAA